MSMYRRLATAGLAVAAALASAVALVTPAASAAPRPARAVLLPAAAPAAAGPVGPAGVHAKGAELVDATTGRLLWDREANVSRPMASITKVMTALVVIRAGHLGQKITITKAVRAYVRKHPDASLAGLHRGDILTARQLLEGMLLPSGCDAAFALAMADGPGWQAFVGKMNATALQLGMTGTHFANFDGMPWPTEHTTYSTPHDLVILGEAAMQSAVFRDIVRQRSHTIRATPRNHAYFWPTTNLLLSWNPGVIGIKTGSTAAAGFCLLFEAQSAGRTLAGVVLHSSATNPDAAFTNAARLLTWGFRVTAGRWPGLIQAGPRIN